MIDIQSRARALLRQSKCPDCGNKGYDDVGGECGWCEERETVLHHLIQDAVASDRQKEALELALKYAPKYAHGVIRNGFAPSGGADNGK